jgi:hypothetical protein
VQVKRILRRTGKLIVALLVMAGISVAAAVIIVALDELARRLM